MKSFLVHPFLPSIALVLLCSCASHPPVATTPGPGPAPHLPRYSKAEAAKWVIYKPEPQYPAEARRLKLRGSGIYLLRVQISAGRVKKVTVLQSAGSPVLDAAAIDALKQWRFKPGALPPIKVVFPHRQDPFAMADSLRRVQITFRLWPQKPSSSLAPLPTPTTSQPAGRGVTP